MQLADNNPLRAIDDEGALRRHQRQLAHEHFLFLSPGLIFQDESYMQRGTVGLTFAQAFQPV